MKVLSLHGIGDLRYEDREKPTPGEGEVLLKIKACGICSSDIERVFVNGTYHFPTVPGHEFAGEIVELGEGVEETLLGKKASVFPMLPCKECTACKEENYALCSNYNYFGSRCDGAYSEYLVVPTWNLVLYDDSVDCRLAALTEPAAVALHATNIGEVKPGQDVAVIGTGTIGILIAAFCKIKGANVYVCGRSKKSLDFVKEFGLETIDTANLEAEVDRLTNGERMDVVFEAVGTEEALANSILSAKGEGTIVVMGNPKGDMHLQKDVYWRILRKQLKIKGTWNSKYSHAENEWNEVSKYIAEGNFPFEKLIVGAYDMKDYEAAFDFLRDRSKSKGKVMFVMD